MQHAHLIHRHKKPVAPRILQQQIIPVQAIYQHGLHTNIAADAMHIMHYIVAAFNICEILQLRALMPGFKAVPPLQAVDIIFCKQKPRFTPKTETAEQFTKAYVDLARILRFIRQADCRDPPLIQTLCDTPGL